jgi:hypothetical protein
MCKKKKRKISLRKKKPKRFAFLITQQDNFKVIYTYYSAHS